jgi:hypothetical protein
MHYAKECQRDSLVSELIEIDGDILEQTKNNNSLEREDILIADGWVDVVNEQVYHCQAVASNIESGKYRSAQELYSAVGTLQDTILENVAEPYWEQVSWHLEGFDNQGQIFKAKNFTGQADAEYINRELQKAVEQPDYSCFNPDLISETRQERHGILDLTQAYVYAKNMLKQTEAEKPDNPSQRFRNYDSGR